MKLSARVRTLSAEKERVAEEERQESIFSVDSPTSDPFLIGIIKRTSPKAKGFKRELYESLWADIEEFKEILYTHIPFIRNRSVITEFIEKLEAHLDYKGHKPEKLEDESDNYYDGCKINKKENV